MKNYLLLHDGRHGVIAYRFISKRDLLRMKMLGITVYEDVDGDMRELLNYLEITLEPADYVTLMFESEIKGMW